MRWNIANTVLLGAAGFAYGTLLAMVGMIAAGGGHGTYVLLGLYASPLSLMTLMPFAVGLALFGTPLLWCVVGVLLAGAGNRGRTTALVLIMLAHYASLPVVLRDGNLYGDWSYVERVGALLPFGIGLYVVGQLAIWVVFAVELLSATARARVSSSPK
jgi:hypothetical protein